MSASLPQWIGPVEAARRLGVSRITIQRWVDRGDLPARRTLGGHRRIEAHDLRVFALNRKLPLAGASRPARRVLVVDDEDDARLWTAGILRRNRPDLELLEAANGFEAGTHIERQRPDLVLLDLRMPGMDGIAVCRWIRRNTDLAGIRVIGLTAVRDARAHRALRRAGAETVLEKPLPPELLLEWVESCLPRHERTRRT